MEYLDEEYLDEEYLDEEYLDEKKEIALDCVTNENITEGVEYEIYLEKEEDGCKVMIFGENSLTLTKDGISFEMYDYIPFKYSRGVLGLEERVKLYIKFANEFFAKYEDIKISTECEEDQDNMVFSVDLKSSEKDVAKFINKVVEFEKMFKEKLSKIESEILQLLNK